MRFLIKITVLVLSCITVNAQESEIKTLARLNGFSPSDRIVKSILVASSTYKIDARELTAIAIVETGLGKYSSPRVNRNGTIDRGLFQINSVNNFRCVEYNLDSPEGSALCAAKLLSAIKRVRRDYIGAYHSKTPSHKEIYVAKINQVFAKNN